MHRCMIKTVAASLLLSGSVAILNAKTHTISQPQLAKSPWQSHASTKPSQTSPIYRQEWQQSKYQSCPILALPTNASVHLKTAKSRAANFSDGFAVAYDVTNYQGKKIRSAYGVANAGKTPLSDIRRWHYQRYYADGSFVTLGREGNNPKGKMLAYVLLENGCFYNVWSQLGEVHLHHIISQLRYVK